MVYLIVVVYCYIIMHVVVLFKLNKLELHDSMLHVYNYRSVVSMHVLIQSHELPYFECHLA